MQATPGCAAATMPSNQFSHCAAKIHFSLGKLKNSIRCAARLIVLPRSPTKVDPCLSRVIQRHPLGVWPTSALPHSINGRSRAASKPRRCADPLLAAYCTKIFNKKSANLASSAIKTAGIRRRCSNDSIFMSGEVGVRQSRFRYLCRPETGKLPFLV